VEGGAAAAAGLRRWDVITRVAGRPVENGDALVRTISALKPGSDVDLAVVRDGRPLQVVARLEERQNDEPEPEEDEAAVPAAAPARPADALGLTVTNLAARAKAELQVPRDRVGVVIQAVLGADPGTDVLEEGDIVVEVNRQATPDLASYRRVVAALPAGSPAWLYVFRPRPRGSLLTRVEVEEIRK
jgi:serine protease Do